MAKPACVRRGGLRRTRGNEQSERSGVPLNSGKAKGKWQMGKVQTERSDVPLMGGKGKGLQIGFCSTKN